MASISSPNPEPMTKVGRGVPTEPLFSPFVRDASFVVKKTLFWTGLTGSSGLKKICLTQRPQDPKGSSLNQPLMNFPGDLPISVYQCAFLRRSLSYGGHAVVEYSFSSSFVIFESFLVNPLQSLWRGTSHSTKLMIKPSSEQSERC